MTAAKCHILDTNTMQQRLHRGAKNFETWPRNHSHIPNSINQRDITTLFVTCVLHSKTLQQRSFLLRLSQQQSS